eukprot:380705_1
MHMKLTEIIVRYSLWIMHRIFWRHPLLCYLFCIGYMDFAYSYSYNPINDDFYGLQTVPIFELPKPTLGKGHTLSGQRKSRGPHDKWFQQNDILYIHRNALTSTEFKRQYCGYSADDLEFFFDTIADGFIKERETYIHARIKFLLWLD